MWAESSRKVFKLRHYHKSLNALARRGLLDQFDRREIRGGQVCLHGPGQSSVSIKLPHGGAHAEHGRIAFMKNVSS